MNKCGDVMKYLVTGGLGFIGTNLVRCLLKNNQKVTIVDKQTYASRPIEDVVFDKGKFPDFRKIDISIIEEIETIKYLEFDVVFHLAAESHVDNSIERPSDFLQTNVVGTYNLLEAMRFQQEKFGSCIWKKLIHVSTDEVYGSLGETGKFTSRNRYEPSSPYSSTKAASDLLVHAWQKTYGLPVNITHCSNNYGKYQNIEKFIPKTITSILRGQTVPVYGDGRNIRDWIHVDDHVAGLMQVAKTTKYGAVYNFGGNFELSNIDVIEAICSSISDNIGKKVLPSDHIEFVQDRRGHDFRYSVDIEEVAKDLGWAPTKIFRDEIDKLVKFYLRRNG